MKTPDTAARISAPDLVAALSRHCAVRISRLPQSQVELRSRQHLYVARFSSGLVKIGIASKVSARLSSLPSEATRRFGQNFIHDTLVPVAVVDCGGRSLELAIQRELRLECVGGEWFRGPLSDAVVDALLHVQSSMGAS